jgi:hypothetical protein
VLFVAAGIGILRIAEARNETAVGGGRVHRLDDTRPEERAAFARTLATLEHLGQAELRERLLQLQRRGVLWAAPGMPARHWALYVDTFGLVRRIYVREQALLSPEDHLFPAGAANIPLAKQQAFARVSLVGALYHELLHYDGVEEEAEAYEREIAWLENLRTAAPVVALRGVARQAIEWGIESAILSARKAQRIAAGTASESG